MTKSRSREMDSRPPSDDDSEESDDRGRKAKAPEQTTQQSVPTKS